jgi:hypothetical protein
MIHESMICSLRLDSLIFPIFLQETGKMNTLVNGNLKADTHPAS